MNPRVRYLVAMLLLSFLYVPFLHGQALTDPTGTWTGAVDLPGSKLKVVVVLGGSLASGWQGTIDIPAQGIRKLALKDISAVGSNVKFSLASVPGNPAFSGTISPDGGTMTGTLAQGGGTFPFTLHRETAASRAEAARTTAMVLDSIRAVAAEGLKRFNVPGMSIAIVRRGEVIFAEGFGYRDNEKKLPVTAGTLFAIGSSTKAFTSLVMATLVDEGKLEWDVPVRRYLPEFEMKSPVATEHMTPRDLLLHISGLPRHDLMWYGATLSREELFSRLKYLEPSADFRTKWQYQNLMYMTAGYLAGRVAGTSWENLVRDRVFTPLGMTSSNFSIAEMERAADAALPYEEHTREGKRTIEKIPYRNIDAVGPAGSINSNATDMAQWVRLHLSDGTLNDKRVVSQDALAEVHRGQVVISDRPSENTELLFTLYAMGWMVQSYHGHRLIHHGGNIDGFSALVSFMPQDSVGIVVLTNANGTPLTTAMMLSIYDRLLKFEQVDWFTRILKDGMKTDETEAEDEEEKPAEPRVSGTEPSHKPADYAGEYEHPAYGVLKVDRKGDDLSATLHDMTVPLEHFHYDVFALKDPDLPVNGLKLQFLTNVKGDIDQVRMSLEISVPEIVFTRRAPADMSTPEALAAYAGDYDIKGTTITVRVQGRNLVVTVPGQPAYTLQPYKEDEFLFKDMQGFSVRFTRDNGKVVAFSFVQPNGVFEAKRK